MQRAIALASILTCVACGSVDTGPSNSSSDGGRIDGGQAADASVDAMPTEPPECDPTKLEADPSSGDYIICDGQQLTMLADSPELHNQRFLLVKDIVAPTPAKGIGPSFSGYFDGLGHTISGWGTTANPAQSALFRQVASGATVKNLRVLGASESLGAGMPNNTTVVGIALIANFNAGDIINVYAEGNVTATHGSRTDPRFAGMIVGVNQDSGVVEICATAGDLNSASNGGGVAGQNAGFIRQCVSETSVSGAEKIGGIVGLNTQGEIKLSMATGEISVSTGAGGCLVGQSLGGEFADSAGRCQSINGTSSIGGLIGVSSGSLSSIATSYSFPGEIEDVTDAGPIIGRIDTTLQVSNVYYNADVFDNTNQTVGIGLLAESINLPSSYAGWDFVSTWSLEDGTDAPRLRWLDQIIPGDLPL